ncbi:MAG: hypothetical protein WCG50_14455 [Rhodoferax sp.]|uniref:hypothetical protein n=1 Tax=Rhodoferax sp. TaxID=50421 RepID=UPI0030163946
MDDLLVSSVVQGAGMAVIFFPIAWLALRKKLNLNKFSESKHGLITAILALPIMKVMGIFGDPATQVGQILGFLGPVLTCALLVYLSRPRQD